MTSAQTICPRCRNAFECNAKDITKCPCVHVHVQHITRRFLEKTNYGCVCDNCLTTLNSMVVKAAETPFDPDSKSLEEWLHYYREGGLIVFTEFYHIWRGYCCEKGCRHCAYGRKTAMV